MSKSVSDQKVEDVLSSVRRLVSSELPRKPRPSVPDGPGALVLTDAHRVEKATKANSAKGSLEDRIAELEAAVSGQTDEFEPDGSEDQAQHRPDRIVYTRPPSSDEEKSPRNSTVRLSQIALIETGPASEDDGMDDGASAGTNSPATFRRESEARTRPVIEDSEAKVEKTKDPHKDLAKDEAPMAVDVPSEPRKSADVKAFTDPDDVVRNIEARLASGRPISEPLPLENPIKPAESEGDDFDSALIEAVAASVASSTADQEVEASDSDAESPDDKSDHDADVLKAEEFNPSIFSNDKLDPHITAAELLADVDVEDENATSEPSEPTAQTADPMPDAEAALTPEPSTPQPEAPSEPSATGDAIAALAALPEEEAMRLLISRMIRDELQGDLGERITRNVRKLVRREVQRALTSKDLT